MTPPSSSMMLRNSLVGLVAIAFAVGLGPMTGRVLGFSYFQVGGVNVVWTGAESVRYLSPSTFPPDSDPLIHYLAAMGLWNIVPATTFDYSYSVLDQDYPIDHFDGFSDTAAVATSSLDPGVLGVTYLVNNGSVWFDMDMVFADVPVNIGWNFETNPTCDIVAQPMPDNGFNFLLVAVHELGHALGLGHDPIGNESPGTTWFIGTMNPRYPSGGPVGQENIIELHTDDRSGLRYLYPRSGPAGPAERDLAASGYSSSTQLGKAVPVAFTPGSVLPEGVITARSVLENFGSTNTVNIRQGYYLSTDAFIDTGDLLLGSLDWDIAFEDAFEFDVDIDMPADIAAGSYYLGYIIDDLGQLTEIYEDNNAAIYCAALTIAQLDPVINDLGLYQASCGQAFTGPAPTVTHPLNMAPLTWSIDNPQPGMTIHPTTGVVSWPSPVRSEFPYTIFLRATNSAGSSTQTLFLGVSAAAPVVATMAPQNAECGHPFTGPVPQVTQPSCMNPIINWSLDPGPPGMTIDFNTGQVFWAHPRRAGSPHTVTVRATNGAGNGTRSFTVTVQGVVDQDADGDSDLVDYALAADCWEGPAVPVSPPCDCADLDGDEDVDLLDMALFAQSYEGAAGACCAANGTCSEQPGALCSAGGGSYRGDGTTCATSSCTGACCLSNGFCLELSATNCAGAAGAFHGVGTTCATTNCTAP